MFMMALMGTIVWGMTLFISETSKQKIRTADKEKPLQRDWFQIPFVQFNWISDKYKLQVMGRLARYLFLMILYQYEKVNEMFQ